MIAYHWVKFMSRKGSCVTDEHTFLKAKKTEKQ